ncbi:protein of unknown function [Bacteroides faecichinchillae]|uniref:DUF4973 domain-containing protein n=1 Tax=Bacteroides faecichinchillae TaxID=871325 RepID=A0A1M4TA67_9BACE|nr:DUF4973 domain-containing protein [Bacteroides faecichinchillae]THG55511.1 DUF4973 domain-containing protein [Bacteroides faecichinchillae]SHE41258.1 protein of unknown function [Bacteroides faecichinchillae]
MKKKYILGVMLGACALFSSCNDEWKDELYREMVSLKAPLNAQGVHDIYVRYHADGSGSFHLPVIVSGSKDNARNINVKISVDNDTLEDFNQQKYSARRDLWYRQLPEQFYSFPMGGVCNIPAGKNTMTYDIDFDLRGLDLNEKWVLPLTIEEDPSYALNVRKGYYKALLNLRLFNEYSGSYASNSVSVYIGDNTSDPATVATRELRVLDDKTVFFYAGTWWEEDIDRNKYKVGVRFLEGTKDENGVETGPLEVFAVDPANPTDIQPYGNCYYRRSVEQHATLPHIEKRTTTIYLNYYYTDVSSDPENPIRYRATGSMGTQRSFNTLIPDEDQAIQW